MLLGHDGTVGMLLDGRRMTVGHGGVTTGERPGSGTSTDERCRRSIVAPHHTPTGELAREVARR